MDWLTIQNTASLGLGLISTTNVVANYLYDVPLTYSFPPLITYCIIDMFYCTFDVKIHHLFIFFNTIFQVYSGVEYTEAIELSRAFFLTELSTIFLSLNYFIRPKSLLYHANSVAFITTFIYTRLYNYYRVFSNPANYTGLDKYQGNITILLYITIYGLFTLNIYWFTLILKKLMKGILKSPTTEKSVFVRRILSFIYIGNPIIGLYISSLYPNISYITHMLGISNLAYHSYMWHSKSLEYTQKHDSFNIVSDELVSYFLNDNAAIQLAGFLASITAYYYSEFFYTYLAYGILYHSVPYAIQYYMTMRLKQNNQVINESSTDFLVTTYILLGIPVLTDIYLCAHFSTIYNTYFPLFTLHVFAGFLLKINPFYQYNHIVFHLLLYVQTFLLAYSNLRII